jgi:phospholipase/carboxylesterase
MFLRKWIVKEPLTTKPRKGCLIILPGRGVPGSLMLHFCREMELRRTLLVSLEPYRLAWYPMPNGANDQKRACMGLPYAVNAVEEGIKRVQAAFGVENRDMALVGFSAGSVVALQVAMRSEQEFAACVSLAGAILEPGKVEPAKNQTPLVLQHNADDECFKWYERYLPMRHALESNGYKVHRLERPFGNHTLYVNDAINVARLIGPRLGYPQKWVEKYLEPKAQKMG